MANNTPSWSAQQNGLPGNLNAVNAAGSINQLLGDHTYTTVYQGTPIVVPTSPTNGGQGYFNSGLGNSRISQPFTMSGTSMGRILIPVNWQGNAADLLVSLYPDNGSGSPATAASPIVQARVPASFFTNLTAPTGFPGTGPLVSPLFTTQFFTNFSPALPWTSPAATVNGNPSFEAITTYGNYSVLAGGEDQTASAFVNNVFTVGYTGQGTVDKPVPQPPLPISIAYGSFVCTGDILVYMGGQNTASTPFANVWSASFNANTGAVGAWSSQTALPVAMTQGAGVAWTSPSGAEYVYYIGGSTSSTSVNANAVSTVYMNSVSNGQVGSSWATTSPLPVATVAPYAGVVGDWMIVCGGVDSGGNVLATAYYAAIKSDGTLGNWKTGPTLPNVTRPIVPGWCTGVTDSSFIVYLGAESGATSSPTISVLPVNATGVGQWNVVQGAQLGERPASTFTDGGGIWYVLGYDTNNQYRQNKLATVTMVSVPLVATGLTNGATYHIVLDQYQSGSSSDFLRYVFNYLAYNGSALVESAPHSNSWSAFVASYSVPFTIYSNTASGQPIHLVEDLTDVQNAMSPVYNKWSTFIYNDSGLAIGACEVTQTPNNVLNQNSTFASGTSPWTATNGTITQSSTQTHGGYAFSGLLTPTGGFSTASAQSEFIAVNAGFNEYYGQLNWYLASGWLYSPTGWSSFSLSVNWYDNQKNLLSTSSSTVSLTANTWTFVSNYFAAPASSAYAKLAPTESSSPGATNLLYISSITLNLAQEAVPATSSIAQIVYPAPTLSNQPTYPPQSISQLV